MSSVCPVGIDLGTSNSVVAVFHNERINVLQNKLGNHITPSCVAFTEDERLVGEMVQAHEISIAPENSVYGIKRMMGRRFEDNILQNDMSNWPYVVKDIGGKPAVQVTFKDRRMTFRPEEISAMILQHMKEIAVTFLHQNVAKAVVTVPAHFNDAQRKATEDAAQIAGIEVTRILNEPTAAALAYGLDKKNNGENVLVFDLGGGTFDVSILMLDQGIFKVLSTAGDTHLGGEDFNCRIVEYMMKCFKDRYKKDISKDKRAKHRLHKVAETIKKHLSENDDISYKIDSFYQGIDFEFKLKREEFETLNEDLFKKTIYHVELALFDAKLTKNEIDNIVLVGGSTRIPKIRSILQNFFEGKSLDLTINPDEAVAYGAAIQASILARSTTSVTDDLLLLDVTPLSLGTSVRGDERGSLMSVVVPRNTPIPSKHTKRFQTAHHNQKRITIRVYEGERERVNDNHFLGEFKMSGIPEAPAGEQKIIMTFDIDADGILDVIAEVCGTDQEGYLTVERTENSLTKAEIDRMIEEARRFQLEDKEDRARTEVKMALLASIKKISISLAENEQKNLISVQDLKAIKSKIREIELWTQSKKCTKQGYERKKDDLEKMWRPMRVKLVTGNFQPGKKKTPVATM